MKATLLTPLSLMLLSLSASAVTLDTPATDAAREPAGNVDTSGDVDQRLAALERRQVAAQHELADLGHESEVLHARTLARGRAYTRLARAGLLPAGGGFQAFVEHAAKLERLHRALGRDLDEERRVAARRTALTKELSGLDQRRAPLVAEQRVIAEAQTALLAARDRDAAFTRAFMTGGGLDDHTAVYGAPETTAVHAASGFASLKGSLPFPISGRSEIRSDHRRGSGPGLAMRAPAGTVVRSVFPGRVAFADTYADYGRTVILDHGGGYYTVSSNLGEIEVKVGEEVKGGARLATLGAGLGDPRDSRGGSAGSTLYFEVRIGQETADPAEWFGI